MFSTISMFVLLAVVGSLISAEVYAAIHAIDFARKLPSGAYSFKEKRHLAGVRYEFGSVFFHELFAARMGQAPAYSTKRTLMAMIAVMAALRGAQYLGAEFTDIEAVAMSTVSALGYFSFAYGPAFLATRVAVQTSMKAGTWEFA